MATTPTALRAPLMSAKEFSCRALARLNGGEINPMLSIKPTYEKNGGEFVVHGQARAALPLGFG